MFLIAEQYLDKDEFQREITPIVASLFRVSDRGIRGALLMKTDILAANLKNSSLNNEVFEPMCSGFSDSSAPLRELTLKSCSVLVTHLTDPNKEKLSRYLVRLQSDAEPTIRTHTINFFAQLAPHLTENSRQKLILPAFIRAMKDVESPSTRLAALKVMTKTKEMFDPVSIASRVLPAVTPQLLDPATEVRREAFAVMDDLLFVMRQESERMATEVAANAANNSNNAPVAPNNNNMAVPTPAPRATSAPVVAPPPPAQATRQGSGGSGSYMSSWLSSSKKDDKQGAIAAASQQQAISGASQSQPPPYQNSAPLAMAHLSLNNNTGMNNDTDDGWGDDDDDGWGDDDGLNLTVPSQAPAAPAAAPTSNPLFGNTVGGDDDFFANAGFSGKPVVASRSMRNGNPSSGKTKLVIGKKSVTATKPTVTKMVADDNLDDGWDDF